MGKEVSQMKKIIGGLLVISFLSRPSLLRFDYIAYEIYKASGQILKNIMSIQETAEKKIEPADVDMAFESVGKNSKGISKLLKDLNNVMGKMNTVMQLKSIANDTMSEEQITTLHDFSEYYNTEAEALNDTLSIISEKIVLKDVKLAIMQEDTDHKQVYDELKTISDHQYDAMVGINNIINNAERTLCLIA